jgi:hypothetical protein
MLPEAHLEGVDLRHTFGLATRQLSHTFTDATTQLPDYLSPSPPAPNEPPS